MTAVNSDLTGLLGRNPRIAALREQTAQNQRTLLEMRSELADARDSRYRNPLVYVLVALLALALLAIGLRSVRRGDDVCQFHL